MGPRRPCPRNPNGHQGSSARIQRNRVMDKAPTFVGIDVAKRRLCLVAERYWDQARWAIEAYAWRFDGLGQAPRAGG